MKSLNALEALKAQARCIQHPAQITAQHSIFQPQISPSAFQHDTKDELGEGFMLTPILVVGLGRSGTTLMMEHLARDRRILFNRTFPFEVRVLSTLAKFCQTLPRVALYGVALNTFDFHFPRSERHVSFRVFILKESAMREARRPLKLR